VPASTGTADLRALTASGDRPQSILVLEFALRLAQQRWTHANTALSSAQTEFTEREAGWEEREAKWVKEWAEREQAWKEGANR
jgi:hypothetical protein